MYSTVEGKSGALTETTSNGSVSAPARRSEPSNEAVRSLYEALRQRFPDILPYVLAFGLLIAVAWPMVTWWYWEYTRPESYYAHAALIPAMVCFMLWYRRTALAKVGVRPFVPAFAVVIPALVLLIVSIKGEMRSVESMSFLMTLWGSILLATGPAFCRTGWFPLGFLLLMAPLPAPLLNDSTLHLQMWSTDLASRLLAMSGFANTQLGNVIHIDNFTLNVDVPCSGFKTLLALLTFNSFLAYMLDGPLVRRVLLFVICSPLALLINGVRIALIGMVGECFGTAAAHVFHDYSGILTLMLGFTVLFALARTLGCRKFAGWDIF